MSTHDLINAIEQQDSITIQKTFNQLVNEKIADKLDKMKKVVAKTIFKEHTNKDDLSNLTLEDYDPESDINKMHLNNTGTQLYNNTIFAQHTARDRYKIHAVGNDLKQVPSGTHLSAAELEEYKRKGAFIHLLAPHHYKNLMADE